MKRIYSLLLLLTVLATGPTWSQTTYTWQGANDASWQVAANWTPTRTTPLASDILQFNSGGSRRITNMPTDQTISKFTITNSTTIRLASVTNLQTLRIGNGVATAGDEFVIDNGSALIQENTFNEIRLQTNASAGIAGTYTIQAAEGFYLNNNGVVATVASTGKIVNQGAINGSSAAKLIFTGGTYEHLQNGGDVPAASWNANSTCEITGMTSVYPDGMDQTFVDVKLLSVVGATGATMTSNLNCTNLTISNTGAGDLRLTNDNSDRTITVSGAFSMTSGNFVLVSEDGDGILNVTGNFSLSGGVFRAKEDAGKAEVNVTGNFNQSGGTFDLRAASGTSTAIVNVTGNFSLSGATSVFDMSGTNNTTGTLNIAGNYTQSAGTLTETAGGNGNGAVNFTGTLVRTFSKTGGTISNTINFNINNGAKVDFGTSILSGSNGAFTLNGGGKIITSHANGLTVATGSIQMTNRSFASTADYEFRGASTGVFTTTTDPQVNNFTVNNTTTSNVVLSKAMTVNGVLALTSGYLTTTTNLLTVGAAGSSTNANGAFVNGPLAKIFTGVASFPFYVGTVSGGLRTISAATVTTAGATSTTFTARFFNSKPELSYPGATLDNGIEAISGCEYWTLDRSTGGTKFNASVTLSWNAASKCTGSNYITDPTTLRVVRHSTTPNKWNNHGSTALTGNPGAGTITTSSAVNTFSPFAIGTTDAEANPLPVIFGDVKAYEKNGSVHVEWSNLTEKDVAEYTIERSANGKDFTAIAKQWPTSNQNDKATYIGSDAVPATGANYYRIKAVETTGKIVYSKILSVNLGKANFGLQLYPNPVIGNQVTVSLSNIKQGKYNVRVVNTSGQDIFKQIINNQSASMTQTLDLPSSVKPGVYSMIITGDNYRGIKTFVVQ